MPISAKKYLLVKINMKILKIKYLHDYKLEVLFSNGETKIADFEVFFKKAKNKSISKFLDKSKFKTVEINTGFLSWNNGEMEISAHSVFHQYSKNRVEAL